MKKFLFIFLIFLFISGLYAQEFKFIQGMNLSSYSISPEVYQSIDWPEVYHYKINNAKGFLMGCGVEFALTKTLAIEIDALNFQKGSNIRYQEVPSLRFDYALNLVNFPILLKIKPLSDPFPYILAGGEFSLILSHKLNGEDMMENTKNFDYGPVFGGGIEIKMPKIILFIEGRYHLGLRNITKDYWRFESIKAKAFVVILAFKFL